MLNRSSYLDRENGYSMGILSKDRKRNELISFRETCLMVRRQTTARMHQVNLILPGCLKSFSPAYPTKACRKLEAQRRASHMARIEV